MSAYGGPDIVDSDLILALDAGNARSYPGTGTTWADLSGNGGTGTLVGSPTYSSTNGGSLVFSGTNYATAATANSLFNFGTGNFSMFMWIKCAATNNYITIGSLDNSASGNGIVFYGQTGSGYFRTWVAGVVNVGTIVVCSGNWINIGITRSSGTVIQYVNGLSNSTFTAANSLLTNQTLALGSNYSSRAGDYAGFPGNIANVNIYNRALSAAEVLQNYNALRGRYGL
jgi:hypothetical protein